MSHMLFSQTADFIGNRGREEKQLPAGRCHGNQRIDVFEKSRLEHLVGFIDNHPADMG